MKSAERAMHVLAFLASRIRPVPSMVIARHLEMPKSSTYHLLNVMRAENFVNYYPDEHAWGLGPSAFEIGSAYLRTEPLTWLGRPLLKELANATGAAAHLAVLHGRDVLYLAKESPSKRGPRLVSRVGLRLPAHLTAVGQAILMALPLEQVRAIYPLRDPLVRRTGRGPVLITELESQLEQARQRGYAIDDGMTTPSITCLAGTVLSHEGVAFAGLGVTYPSSQLGVPPVEKLAGLVKSSAVQLSLALGWRSQSPAPENDLASETA